MRQHLPTFVVIVAAAVTLSAQTFEVASVRPTTAPSRVSGRGAGGGADGWRIPHPPGRFEAQNWSLRSLIAHAYGLAQATAGGTVFALRGGDDNVLRRGYDIQATLPDGVRLVSLDEERAMLRALLADRFGLRVHIERQRVPIYALRRDGDELGRGLTPATLDCMTILWQRGRLETQPTKEDLQTCADMRGDRGTGDALQQVYRSSGEIAALIQQLQGHVDRPIVDETGLTGLYAWDLAYRRGMPTNPVNLIDALADQLRLKLVPSEGDADVVVIDAVSEPEPN